ncbi:hypothetical protein MYU51_006699 [Penicillium brevicompactum]
MSSLSTDPSILRPITQIQTGISDRTETCQSLFSRCVSNTAFSDENLDWYESRQGEFNLWASILKATDIGRSSLDYRLQDDDELRGRICGLLEGLSESLKTLLQPDSKQIAESDSSGPVNVADSIFSDFSSDNEESSSSPKLKSYEVHLPEDMFLVKLIIGHLWRLSTNIRRPGTSYRHRRADIALERDKESFADFKSYLAGIIRSSSFNAFLNIHGDPIQLTQVQERLIDANIVRRNRIIFATASTNHPEQPPIRRYPAKPFDFNATSVAAAQFPEDSPEDLLQQYAPLSVEGSTARGLTRRLKTSEISQAAGDLSSQFTSGHDPQYPEPKKNDTLAFVGNSEIDGDQDYPACPEPVSDEALQCPYCGDMLPVEYSRDSSVWSIESILLMTYCRTLAFTRIVEFEMYLTSDDLFKHMLNRHGIVHQQLWQRHMEKEHPEFPVSQIASLASVSKRTMLEPLACPLCDYVSENAMTTFDDHIASHLHKFALLCLPWGPTGCSEARRNSKAPKLAFSSLSTEDHKGKNAEHYTRSFQQSLVTTKPLFTPDNIGTTSPAPRGPIPATTPLVVRQDASGVEWIAFEYSRNRVKMEYTIRCDVESVDVDTLPEPFKTENCIYPRAFCSKDQYRGNRLVHETEYNALGWALAELNPALRGKRGLLQRAVDSWRNSNQDPRLRSRRIWTWANFPPVGVCTPSAAGKIDFGVFTRWSTADTAPSSASA